jgi:acyl-coenzyme A thioesterase PaaI-like protein
MLGLDIEKAGNPIRAGWNAVSKVPGGRRLFSEFIGRMAPYTGTIGAKILDLEVGFCRAEMKDRRAVRNHLKSVHAIALMNFAEVCSGVGLMYSLDENTRGILKGLEIEFLKKARGTLTATCRFDSPASGERQEFLIHPEIFDEQGEMVARATATWLIGPKKR